MPTPSEPDETQTVTFDPSLQVVVWWNDLTLWQASKYAADRETFWRSTMWPIRQTMSMSDDAYWNLTVADHAELLEHLKLEGAG